MNPFADRLAQVLGRPYDIYEHLPTFVRAVEDLSATTVIELGVRAGVSTIAWLYGMHARGHVFSVDGAPPVPDEFGNDLLGDLMTPDRRASAIDGWTFLCGWDNDPDVLAELPEQADIVFVDTQHTYEVTSEELALYRPRVRPGGRMLFHDTALYETGNAVTPQPPYPVRTAIEEFCAAEGLVFTHVDNCNGLGTVFIP